MDSDQKHAIGSFLFIFGCCLGCGFQVYQISELYFNYDVATSLQLEVPYELRRVDQSTCFRYVEIFDFARFERDKGPNVFQGLNMSTIDTNRIEDVQEIQDKLTLQDLFTYTPFSNDVFDECVMRNARYYSYHRDYGRNCSRMFTVSRFFLQEFICYTFNVVNDSVLHVFRNPAYAQTYPNTIFLVKLNSTAFQKADEMKLIVHEANTLPIRSSAFAPTTYREFDPKTNESQFNWFDLTYNFIIHHRMAPPYKTQCRDYNTTEGVRSAFACFNLCVIRRVTEQFGKVPFSSLIKYDREILKYKPISPYDVANFTFSEELRQTEIGCIRHCSQEDCEEIYAVTSASPQPDADSKVVVVVNTARQPSFIITFRAQLQMIEFIVQLFSIVSTWFGLSFISFDPMRIAKHIQKRRKKAAKRAMKIFRKTSQSLIERSDRKNSPNDGCSCCQKTRTEVGQQMFRLIDEMESLKYAQSIELRPLTTNIQFYEYCFGTRKILMELINQLHKSKGLSINVKTREFKQS